LDKNFYGSEGIYQNIKEVLYNSIFKIELFKKDFRVYDMDNKEIELFSKEFKIHDENSKKKEEKERMNRGLDYLIELKDNINLNFEDLPENSKMSEDKKKELKEKRKKIEIFVKYIERL
jgi:hypothetical protein